MSKGKGHIPIRTCIICKEKKSKYELIRIAAGKDGIARRDDKAKIGGRGAYVCPRKECIERLLSRPQVLAKALRRSYIKGIDIGGIYGEDKSS